MVLLSLIIKIKGLILNTIIIEIIIRVRKILKPIKTLSIGNRIIRIRTKRK